MKSIFSSLELYMWAMVVDQKTTCFIPNLLCLWYYLLSNRLEDMENGKRSTEEALDESMPPHQHLCHWENATHDLGRMDLHLNALHDAPIVSEHRADSTQPSRSSSSTIRHPLPRYQRKQINNNDLIASIDHVGQKLADCLSIVESALTTLVQRGPPFDSDLSEANHEIPGVVAAIHQDALRGRSTD